LNFWTSHMRLKLPDSHYEFAEWKKAKVQFNIMSVMRDIIIRSLSFIHKEVDIKSTQNLIEVYCKRQ